MWCCTGWITCDTDTQCDMPNADTQRLGLNISKRKKKKKNNEPGDIEFVNCIGAFQITWCMPNSKLRFLSNPKTTVLKLLKKTLHSINRLIHFFLVDIYQIVISVEIMKLIVKWHLKIYTNMFTLFFPLFKFFIQLFKWNHLIDNCTYISNSCS